MDVLVSFLIIIDDICPDRADLSGSAGDPEPACVLSFHYDQQALEVWVDRVKEQTHHRPKLIHGGAWFHAVASKVKDDYSELVADIPDRNLRFGKTLKAFLAFEGKLSLWWLLEVSMKNSEAKTVFNRLCQLYVILDELEGGSYTAIQVYSSDAAFSDVLSRLALRRRLAFISEAGSQRHINWRLLTQFVARIKWFVFVTLVTTGARLWSIGRPSRGKIRVAFFTLFPHSWFHHGLEEDEKYRQAPAMVEQALGSGVAYAHTALSDGYYQNPDEVRKTGGFRECFRRFSGRDRIPFVPIDAELGFRDLLAAFWSKPVLMPIVRLCKDRKFQSMWRLRGVDIYPLVEDEIIHAVRRVPGYLVEALRVRRFIERYQVECFVAYPFEYCYGRAILYGALSARSKPKVVTMQHGPISSYKLLYHHCRSEVSRRPELPGDAISTLPQADRILVEGSLASDILTASGFEPRAIRITGAPRLDDMVLNVASPSNSESGRPRVLFVLGLHDYRQIIAFSRQLIDSGLYELFFRPHPKVRGAVEKILLASEGTVGLDELKLEASIACADVVVTTYSSAGIEAILAGKPAICVALPNTANLSPLVDLPGGIRTVYTADDLRVAVGDACGDGVSNVDLDSLKALNFHKLDGRSSERVADAILEVLGSDSKAGS